MKKIRKDTFETNSSSTNSLVISNSDNYIIPEKLTVLNLQDARDFYYGTPDEKFTVLISRCDSWNIFKLCWKLYSWGVKEIVLIHPDNYPMCHEYPNVGEIDDSYAELDEILEDDELCKRFLFSSDSYIDGEDNNMYW